MPLRRTKLPRAAPGRPAWAVLAAFTFMICPASVFAGRVPRGAVDGWLTLDQTFEALRSLVDAAPALIHGPVEIGRSIENRSLWAACAGACDDPSAVELLITAMHHGREPLGLHASLAFIDWLVSAAAAGSTGITSLLRRSAVWVVPCVNPDAYAFNLEHWSRRQIMARKNRRQTCLREHASYDSQGVDLNRNYDFAWSVDNAGSSPDPCAEDFRGSAPFSEPETRAIRAFVEAHHFSIALNWHSYGRVTNLPYGTLAVPAPPLEVTDTILSLAGAYQRLVGWGYGHPADNGLGYSVNGEASDWMLASAGVFAMSPEVGPRMDEQFERGMWPAEASLAALLEETRAVSAYSLAAAGPLLLPRATRVVAAATAADGGGEGLSVELAVRNAGVRNATGPLVVTLLDTAGGAGDICATAEAGDAAAACARARELIQGLLCNGPAQGLAEFGAGQEAGQQRCAAPSAAAARTSPVLGGPLERCEAPGLSSTDCAAAGSGGHRSTLSRTARVLAAHAAAAVGAPSSSSAGEHGRRARAVSLLSTTAAAVDAADTADAGSPTAEETTGSQRRRLLRSRRTGDAAGADVPLTGTPFAIGGVRGAAFAQLLGGGGGGGLPAQFDSERIRLALAPAPGAAPACSTAARATLQGACAAAGLSQREQQQPDDSSFAALLGVSDDRQCRIYGVPCDAAGAESAAELPLLFVGDAACEPCSVLRWQCWGSSGGSGGSSAATCAVPLASATQTQTLTPSRTGSPAAIPAAASPSPSATAAVAGGGGGGSPSSAPASSEAAPPPTPTDSASSSSSSSSAPAAASASPSPALPSSSPSSILKPAEEDGAAAPPPPSPTPVPGAAGGSSLWHPGLLPVQTASLGLSAVGAFVLTVWFGWRRAGAAAPVGAQQALPQ